jgi:hypothetical protein
MLSMLVVILLVISGAFLALKLVPLYIDDYAIGKAVTSLGEEPDLYSKSKTEIRSFIRRKLAADYTTALADDAFIIEKNKGTITIDVVYEARVPIVHNLDVVANFKHHIEKSK